MCEIAIFLTVLGGILELGGLALVVLEIRSDRRLADRYLEKLTDAPPAGFYGPAVRPEVRLMDEHRLTHGPVEQQVRLLRETHSKELRRVTDAASRATYEERARFQAFVRDLLQGGLGQRKIGAGLIAAGIVASMAGNVVSASA